MTPICSDKFSKLYGDIISGASRHSTDKVYDQISKQITDFEATCSIVHGEYLRILLDSQFSKDSVPSVITRFENIQSSEEITNDLKLHVFSWLAKVTLGVVSWNINREYRQQAFELAQECGNDLNCLVIKTNWMIASIQSEGDVEDWLIQDIEELIANIGSEYEKENDYRETVSRFESHKAKIIFNTAIQKKIVSESEIKKADALYEKSIRLIRLIDHRRINITIEWAEKKIIISDIMNVGVDKFTQDLLISAHRGLDTHNCLDCEGYYHKVNAHFLFVEAKYIGKWQRPAAKNYLRDAQMNCKKCIGVFRKHQHPYLKIAHKMEQRISELIEAMNNPNKIFLSHAGADKPMVRRYRNVLKTMNFDPWFDESTLVVGSHLERSLVEAFPSSCAAVFFITSNFIDEEYLAAEIDYAVQEKRKRPEFAIISLRFKKKGKSIEIPSLLKSYAWKDVKYDLDAMDEILNAIPLKLPLPDWPPDL